MGRPRSDGALLKRSTSQVSSNDGPLLSRVAWETQWQKSPKDWVDYANSLHKVMKTFHDIINEVPKLQEYAKKYSKQCKGGPSSVGSLRSNWQDACLRIYRHDALCTARSPT